MKTKLTELLDIKYPLLQGAMAWVSEANLASAVSNAGGAGIIATGGRSAEWTRDEIRKAKDLTAAAVAKVSFLQPLDMIRVPVSKRALVIGGGVAGISAALDLAEQNIPVTLVEKEPTIGGVMAQLNKTFPTMDCSI